MNGFEWRAVSLDADFKGESGAIKQRRAPFCETE